MKLFLIHTANITGDTAQTGLVEYAATLARTQDNHSFSSCIRAGFLSNCESATLPTPADWPTVYDPKLNVAAMIDRFPQQALLDHLRRTAQEVGHVPVLVAHVGSRTGAHIAPWVMAEVPTIIVSHEFSRLSDDQKRSRVSQLAQAKKVLFSTESERDEALAAVASHVDVNRAQELFIDSKVLPVPSNILPPTFIKPPEQRSRDIVIFGMIKAQKGLEYVPAIAEAMQKDRFFQGRSIHLVGTVLIEGGSGDRIVKDLLPHIFKVTKEALDPLNAKQILEAADILQKGSLGEKAGISPEVRHALSAVDAMERRLPIHLHLNQTYEGVQYLLNSNRYSFLPMPRGATEHSGTLAASLEHHMVTFVCENDEGETPGSLKNGSVHLLRSPHQVLHTIKVHEIRAAVDCTYEHRLIALGDDFRSARSWDYLAKTINNMALEAAAPPIVSRVISTPLAVEQTIPLPDVQTFIRPLRIPQVESDSITPSITLG